MDFQDVILNLQEFWAKEGCVIWQPYDIEVGAGTFNPATFLKALGPEPWKVAYVEPSRRQTDGRYGENPNRFQKFYQFQVILKPTPENAQQLYIDSLIQLGVDVEKHDLRFVEDDWEQPSVGAAGLGWEVWLDGLEISQYTYFQVVGSIPTDPVCVEYTYGLERIAMFLQGVDNFVDLKWVGDLTYGDMHLEEEKQFSTFNFEYADIELHRKWFEEYEQQAEMLLEKNLVLPAYDFVLKASNTFNLLDARNAISVTQRAMYIGRIRKLAQQVAQKYIEHRKSLGFPLLNK